MQEVDLAPGETLIGRSLDCQITLEDPLVSRVHVRMLVRGDDAFVEDLGSRNGIKLNGVPLRGASRVKNGDRIRIGTQEVVVTRIDSTRKEKEGRHSRATGILRICVNCQMPYPREVLACPSCESIEQVDESTMSGTLAGPSSPPWSFQLAVEALERSIQLGRVDDAVRLLERARTHMEEHFSHGGQLEIHVLRAIAHAAALVALEVPDASWARWAVRTLRAQGVVPLLPTVDRLRQIVLDRGAPMAGDLNEMMREIRALPRPLLAEEVAALTRLEEIVAAAAEGGHRVVQRYEVRN
jgi:pSer/pThr/pTyr-binding forkhead associated (FHA) protein